VKSIFKTKTIQCLSGSNGRRLHFLVQLKYLHSRLCRFSSILWQFCWPIARCRINYNVLKTKNMPFMCTRSSSLEVLGRKISCNGLGLSHVEKCEKLNVFFYLFINNNNIILISYSKVMYSKKTCGVSVLVIRTSNIQINGFSRSLCCCERSTSR
jgi:hypothetical protein